MGRSSISLSAGMEVKPGADTSGDVTAASFFATLPDREVAEIWDAVFTDDGGPALGREEAAARAMKRWKLACAAMSPDQREEVHNVCILDSFPQWIIQRAHGHMETSWERKRDLLIAGLRAIRAELHPPKGKPEKQPETAVASPRPRAQVERTVYVDEDGEPLLEVERVVRRPAA